MLNFNSSNRQCEVTGKLLPTGQLRQILRVPTADSTEEARIVQVCCYWLEQLLRGAAGTSNLCSCAPLLEHVFFFDEELVEVTLMDAGWMLTSMSRQDGHTLYRPPCLNRDSWHCKTDFYI